MTTNKKIIYSLIFICILFFILMAYLTYFELFKKEEVVANSFNQRLSKYEDEILRGSIYDRNGTILAYSEGEEENQKRIYPYNNTYSHVIGYSSKAYGKTLIEARYNQHLLGLHELKAVVDLKNELTGQRSKGNDVYLTLEHDLQELGEELLKGKQGSIVAMEPTTGEILAMVSQPSFNPNGTSLEENWSNLVESENSPFVARATQGLYPPGSTFKTVIAASAIENGLGDTTFDDRGSVDIDGRSIKNYSGRALGNIDLKKALTHSSNVAFAEMGVYLGEDHLKKIADDFYFNRSINIGIDVKKSSFLNKKMDKNHMAEIGIGQGEILVTPLHMAMITSSIANDGNMMEPFLIREITGFTGNTAQEPKVLKKTMSAQTANIVTDMMEAVVNEGTGTNANIGGVRVAGKTGTAENEGDKDHAWFIGFAPAENPKIAVAVVIENADGTGGQEAAPIAKRIMERGIQ